jgi:hypothetical protein
MRRTGSVQDTHFRIETIERDTLRLVGHEYRAVLECAGVAVHVLPVAEQEAILAGHASFLNALAFPTQLVVRIQRRSLELHIRAVQEAATHFGQRRETAALAQVATGYIDYLSGLHKNAALLDRRCYIVVPADPRVVHAALPAAPTRRERLWAFLSRRPPEAEEPDEDAEGEEVARDHYHDPREAIFSHLQFRCDQLIRLLARSGMPAWRVTGPALHHLIYACWNPEQARLYPLQEEHLAFPAEGEPRRSLVARQRRRPPGPGQPLPAAGETGAPSAGPGKVPA